MQISDWFKISDKTLFSMDLVAMMAVEDIAEREQKSKEDVLIAFMESNTAKMLYDDCRSEGFPVELDLLEAHYLAGGNVLHTVQTVIDANKANVKLDFKEAAALDLAGDQMLEVAKNIAKRQVLERHH